MIHVRNAAGYLSCVRLNGYEATAAGAATKNCRQLSGNWGVTSDDSGCMKAVAKRRLVFLFAPTENCSLADSFLDPVA